jgi:hypothetical protein
MTPIPISAEFITTAGGVLLSLGISYIPGLQARFDRLDGVHKRLVMLGLLALASLGVFGLACLQWGDAGNPLQALGVQGVTCSQAGALGLIRSFVLAVIANQATFLISPRPGCL